ENKVIGIRIDDPAPDFAAIARGFGIHAEGPIDSVDAVGPALRRALRVVKDEGRPALVDVLTRLEGGARPIEAGRPSGRSS
ncbi:MAG TPA: thiamine pyrophosphate-dependent enzyme, partial [Candidatus Limnocylindrales bacterium]|nr:thiamine pyrophosphate-dependent enzyme [Candidatus Limnocylindrales bacterium]